MNSATLVIRTKNEAKCLEQTLDLIDAQTIKPVEIIVIDSGSTDKTLEILERRKTVKVVKIAPMRFSFGRALNIGFEAALTDVVISLSAHAFPCNEHWLAALLQHFDDPDVAGVYGRQLPHVDAWPPVKRDYVQGCYGDGLRVQQNPDSPADHVFSNANAAIRKTRWNEYAFDEHLPYCEDRDWARAMLKAGYKIIYEPRASVYHSHNESLISVYRRNYCEARALQSLYESRPLDWRTAFRMWREAVQGDIRFILTNGEKPIWFARTAIYRLFWALGWLRPHLSKL